MFELLLMEDKIKNTLIYQEIVEVDRKEQRKQKEHKTNRHLKKCIYT